MNIKHTTYRVIWLPEDGEHVGLCAEFPSLSRLAKTPATALKGIQKIVADVVANMQTGGEASPVSTVVGEVGWEGNFYEST